MNVRELLQTKGHEVISIDADHTVEAAIKVMTDRKISAVLVTKHTKPVGIFTERDVLRSYVQEGDRFHAAPLERVMTADVIVAEPDEDLCNVMSIMIEKGIRHVPVAEKGKIVGLLSIRDVVKTQVGKLKTEIHHLKDYLSGI